MRIGVFLTEGATPTNGLGMYQQALLDGLLAQDRHTIVVLIAAGDEVPSVRAQHEVVRIKKPRARVFSALGVDVFADGAATLAARRARLDLLVGNAQFGMPRVPGVTRVAVLFEAAFAEPSPWAMYASLTQRQWRKVTARNLRGADLVLCLSEHGRHELARVFGVPLEHTTAAPPALSPFPSVERSTFRPTAKYVLEVGWFHPRKDVTLALAAWRAAVDAGLDADLVLAGAEGPPDRRHGSLGRRILDTVGHDLATRVHFTGMIPRGDLGALYRDASAVLMTSHHEGFGIPAIEAFSLGVPVVAVNRTSLPEVVGPVGVVAQPDPVALGAALVKVCHDPGDVAAMRAYAATFTAERQVAPIVALADRMAGHVAP